MDRRRCARIVTASLFVWLAACGDAVEAPDLPPDIPWSDVVRFAPVDVPGTPVPDDVSGIGDVLADALPPEDGDNPGPDLPVLPDLTDTQVPDLPNVPDVKDLVPELPDTGTVDAGACGTCPAAQPMCVDEQCVCTGTSCPAGFYCKGGACTACNVDLHCGPDCESCASQGMYCAADGAGCVACDGAHPCPASQQCLDGECTDCESLGLCGPNCLECTGSTPDCVDGQCACNQTSCGALAVCVDKGCVGCTDDDPDHCGPDCLVCGGNTPHCLAGECVLCNTAQACGDACKACAGDKPVCRPDGGGCVQCVEAGDCPPNNLCTQNVCEPPCQAQGCAGDLSQNGKKCSTAIVVGRVDAAQTAHFSKDTSDQGNDDDLNYFMGHSECWDAAYDHFYRVYLMAGESVTAVLTPKAADFNAMLKLYEGTECDKDSAGIFDSNDDYLIQCWNSGSDGEAESFSHTVSAEGWYTVVVDGRRAGDDYDWGPYDLDLTISCQEENCCCL